MRIKAHVDETDPDCFPSERSEVPPTDVSKGFLDSARFQAGEHVLGYGGAAIGVFAIR